MQYRIKHLLIATALVALLVAGIAPTFWPATGHSLSWLRFNLVVTPPGREATVQRVQYASDFEVPTDWNLEQPGHDNQLYWREAKPEQSGWYASFTYCRTYRNGQPPLDERPDRLVFKLADSTGAVHRRMVRLPDALPVGRGVLQLTIDLGE